MDRFAITGRPARVATVLDEALAENAGRRRTRRPTGPGVGLDLRVELPTAVTPPLSYGRARVRLVDRVDYVDTFIAVADDSQATKGTPPPVKREGPSVAARTYQMIAEHPYEFTSGDVIFTVFADRHGIPEVERAAARVEFYSKSQACLRSSDLGKRYGWGIHADARGRVALFGVDTLEYAEFVSGQRRSVSGAPIALTKSMRSSRPGR